MTEFKDYLSLILTAMSSGGVVYLITYFFRGKENRDLQEKTIIGYLKTRVTNLEKKEKINNKRIKELEKKYLDLEFMLELTDFEKKLAFKWIANQPNADDFFDKAKIDVKDKKDFLDKIKMAAYSTNEMSNGNLKTIIKIPNKLLLIFIILIFLFSIFFLFRISSSSDIIEQQKIIEKEKEVLELQLKLQPINNSTNIDTNSGTNLHNYNNNK